MASATPITIIVNSLRGQNVAFPLQKDASLSYLYDTLFERAPWIRNSSYILTTNSRRSVSHGSAPVSSLLSSPFDTFLSLRLTVPLCGGKGGFGSILRAQGGRMSSRKKKNSGQDPNGSSRNLDGRRLRTVAEAKALAEYLAIKPEMEKKEKDERRKRWEDIVANTERKQDEILNGRGQARLDGQWVEDKAEAENKTREAIEKMLLAQRVPEEADTESDESPEPAASSSKPVQQQQKTMFGWDDEDDEFMSDSEDEDEVSEEDAKPEVATTPQYEGKGKGKAAV